MRKRAINHLSLEIGLKTKVEIWTLGVDVWEEGNDRYLSLEAPLLIHVTSDLSPGLELILPNFKPD